MSLESLGHHYYSRVQRECSQLHGIGYWRNRSRAWEYDVIHKRRLVLYHTVLNLTPAELTDLEGFSFLFPRYAYFSRSHDVEVEAQ